MTEPLLELYNTTPLNSQPGIYSKNSVCSTIVIVLTWPFRFTYNNGVCCCIAAQLFYALVAILIRMLSNNGVPILQILFMRSLFISAASFTSIKIARKGTVFGPKKFWLFLAYRAVIGSFGMTIYFASIPLIAIGDAVALSKLTPIFSILFAWMLGWEQLNYLVVIGTLLCTAGGVVITHPPLLFGGNNHWNKETVIGYSFAFTSAVIVGSSFLATGKMGTAISEFSIAFSGHVTCVIWIGICLCFSFPSPLVWLDKESSLLLIPFLPGFFIAHLLLIRGIQLCEGIQASTLQTSGIAFSYVLSFLIFGEKITVFAVVGTIIVSLGIVVQAFGKAKAQHAKVVENLETSAHGDEDTEP